MAMIRKVKILKIHLETIIPTSEKISVRGDLSQFLAYGHIVKVTYQGCIPNSLVNYQKWRISSVLKHEYKTATL